MNLSIKKLLIYSMFIVIIFPQMSIGIDDREKNETLPPQNTMHTNFVSTLFEPFINTNTQQFYQNQWGQIKDSGLVKYSFDKTKKACAVVISNPSLSIALGLGMAFSPTAMEEIPVAAQLFYAFTKGKLLFGNPINLKKVVSELFCDRGLLQVCKDSCYAIVIGLNALSFLNAPLELDGYALNLFSITVLQAVLDKGNPVVESSAPESKEETTIPDNR